MSIFDSRKPKETLEEFFLRVNRYFSEKIIGPPTVPAEIKPGPTDANGTPVEEIPETETRSGALHPPHKTGI